MKQRVGLLGRLGAFVDKGVREVFSSYRHSQTSLRGLFPSDGIRIARAAVFRGVRRRRGTQRGAGERTRRSLLSCTHRLKCDREVRSAVLRVRAEVTRRHSRLSV